jgi:hypothetical protein
MIETLQLASLALAFASTLFVLVLVLRRVSLAREERQRVAIEERLRDTALSLVDGEAVPLPELNRTEAEVFAGMLARYARQLAGEPRGHIARYFENGGHVDAETGRLGSRAIWRRAAAAAVLGDMGSRGAIPALIELLDDPAREVRAAAARSLAILDADEAVAPLVRALAEGRLQRAVVGWALMRLGEPAVPRLHPLLGSDNADVRAAAVELIGLIGSAADAPAVLERLRDPAAEVRAKSARALGRLGAAQAAAALRDALGDRIFFVRAAAARALGDIGDAASAAALVRQAQTDRFEAAHAAALALAEISPQALEGIATLSTATDHVREAAGLAALA